jgi:hypothetical protein
MSSEEGVDISTLTPQQLNGLAESLQGDLQMLNESIGKLQGAVSRFHHSGVALEELGDEKPGAGRASWTAAARRERAARFLRTPQPHLAHLAVQARP